MKGLCGVICYCFSTCLLTTTPYLTTSLYLFYSTPPLLHIHIHIHIHSDEGWRQAEVSDDDAWASGDAGLHYSCDLLWSVLQDTVLDLPLFLD